MSPGKVLNYFGERYLHSHESYFILSFQNRIGNKINLFEIHRKFRVFFIANIYVNIEKIVQK